MKKYSIIESTTLGSVVIDEQNKKTFTLIDELTNTDTNLLHTTKENLLNWINAQFETKEASLKKSQYPFLDEHITMHKEYLTLINAMVERLSTKEKKEKEIKRVLKDRFLEYICKADLKQKNFKVG